MSTDKTSNKTESKNQKKTKYQKKESTDSNESKTRYKPDDETTQMHIKRVVGCKKNKVNFISGTVTPCQSNKYKKEEFVPSDIESLTIGLRYLFDMYGKNLRLSIQPKFMGSRLNMYLFRDDHLNKSYSVTRNGFICKLSKDEMTPLFDIMHQRLNEFMKANKITMMILDGELLPWSALGHGLINNEFMPVDKGLETEIMLMKKYDFDSEIPKISSEQTICDPLKMHTISETEKMYEVYHKQMMLYAGDNHVLEYKPFGILKMCFEDDSESVPLIDHSYGQSEMYEMVRNSDLPTDQQLVVDLTVDNFDENVEIIKQFYEKLTFEQGYEGICIKPEFVEPGKLPMMKCRNTEYLTIIYGYDYMTKHKLERLIKNKQTKFKIKQSVREFEQGMELLQIKYSEIETNDQYTKVMMKYLYNESFGETLDPRL